MGKGLIWALMLAALPFAAAAQGMAEVTPVEFDFEGVTVSGIAAGPEDAPAAVLFVHDFFGLSPAAHQNVSRLAGLGYRVLGIDLYHGTVAADQQQAGALMGGLDPARVAIDLRGGVDWLQRGGRPIATLGFSMGAAPAMNAAYLSEGVVAVANVYGGGAEGLVAANGGTLPAPFLFITGSNDGWPMGALGTLIGAGLPASHQFEFYVHPGAQHGFAQPMFNGGANLNPEASRITWTLIEAFLAREMGG